MNSDRSLLNASSIHLAPLSRDQSDCANLRSIVFVVPSMPWFESVASPLLSYKMGLPLMPGWIKAATSSDREMVVAETKAWIDALLGG
jgi:hypothetical protein